MTTKYSGLLASILVAITLVFVVPVNLARSSEIQEKVIRTDILYDPLFGIEYRPCEIHFENAPDAVFTCKDLKTRRGDLFLFGNVTKGKVQFYYVYGWVEVDLDGPNEGVRHFEAESDSGIIVVVSPDGCREIGAGYAWSPDKRERQMAEKYGITDAVVSALFSDAIEREVRAFGGKTEFLRMVAAAGVNESSLPPQLLNKLKDMRGVKENP